MALEERVGAAIIERSEWLALVFHLVARIMRLDEENENLRAELEEYRGPIHEA